MYSVIDIGSNTIRLSVYEAGGGALKPIFREKSHIGLAGYVSSEGRLSRLGLERAAEVICQFCAIVHRLSIPSLAVFATASLRNISNTQEALDFLSGRTGCQIEVLSGEEEALMDFIGATGAFPLQDGLLVDIGGGSTELVFFRGGAVQRALSIPVGSLNLFHRYVSQLLPEPKECARIQRRVAKELDKLDLPQDRRPMICGVGGSVRAAGKLARWQADLPPDHRTLSCAVISQLLDRFCDQRRKNLDLLLQTVPERIHTLLPGMAVLRQIAQTFHSETIFISDCGVREGYLLTRVLGTRRLDGQ
ncbi:phosphatase [Pseudoflavonifractor sp. 524-17]|uniref:Ppx/GppA phosphatase family protein n=1 Tax=Pseudoflavonifractor sp. 524-17 TaxID=2304577 RepID=UPI00137B43A4|nr:phosphatase [Pseudoflavonifractor sp. 524-17]NCE64995.1 phosphatase [Pseudoflavonifractor sp. 524-17]